MIVPLRCALAGVVCLAAACGGGGAVAPHDLGPHAAALSLALQELGSFFPLTPALADCVAAGTVEAVGPANLEGADPDEVAGLAGYAIEILRFDNFRARSFVDVFPDISEAEALRAAEVFAIDCELPLVELFLGPDAPADELACVRDALDLDAYAEAQAHAYMGRFEESTELFLGQFDAILDACPQLLERPDGGDTTSTVDPVSAESARRLVEVARALGGDLEHLVAVELEQFFEGNHEQGSIAPNLVEHPGPEAILEALVRLRARPDVSAVVVLVQLEYDVYPDGEWPYAEAVQVVTSAPLADIDAATEALDTDPAFEGPWGAGAVNPPPLPPGQRLVTIWWD